MNKFILLSLSFALSLLITSPSFGDTVIPGRCHMGECWEQKFIGKTLLKSGSSGNLYAVEIATRSWAMNSSPNVPFSDAKTNYVYCSTKKPAYIFKIEGKLLAHLLNPGGDWAGYNQSDYPIYWVTCHNLVGPDFFSERMTETAKKLGYSLDLTSGQIELTDVLEILD